MHHWTDRIGAAVHISPDLRTQKAQGRGGSRHQKFDLAIPAISNILGMLLESDDGRAGLEGEASRPAYVWDLWSCTVLSQDSATIPSVSNIFQQNNTKRKYDEV